MKAKGYPNKRAASPHVPGGQLPAPAGCFIEQPSVRSSRLSRQDDNQRVFAGPGYLARRLLSNHCWLRAARRRQALFVHTSREDAVTKPLAVVGKPNVLAVDDKPSNLVALEAVLHDDCNVIRAYNGAEAIALCGERRDIDVILMDVHMPAMDGYETAAAIKKMSGCRDIPIIFITAVYHEDPYVKKGYEAGGIDYFGKPFDPEILKMKIAVYTSFRRRASHIEERERHVHESQELLRVGRKMSSVLESLPVGVLIADIEGRICQTTQEVSRILRAAEATDNDVYGGILGWWDAGGQMIKESGPLARALHLGESSHSERMAIKCFDGVSRTILVSTSPLRGVDGVIVGAVILIQDLSESSQIKEDLEERVNRLMGVGVELEQSAVQ
jgi:CheY-like chemotaxis protein